MASATNGLSKTLINVPQLFSYYGYSKLLTKLIKPENVPSPSRLYNIMSTIWTGSPEGLLPNRLAEFLDSKIKDVRNRMTCYTNLL